MPWQTKWHPDVKAGVFAAVFDHALSASRAHELARSGELPQLKPGEPRPAAVPGLPIGTVRDWLRHERARRHRVEVSRAEPIAVLGATIGRLAAVLEREVSRVERQSANGTLKPERVRELARAGLELQRLAAAAGKSSSAPVQTDGDGPSAQPETPAASGGWLEGLAAEPDTTA